MIFILGKTGSRERKFLSFKKSSKTFTQDATVIKLRTSSVTLCHLFQFKPLFLNDWHQRGTPGLQCIHRVQLRIHTTHLPCSLPCNYVTSLLAYCRGYIRINKYRYCIKLLLSISNSSVKKLPNLKSSFLIIGTSWKSKTLIISAQTFRIVINLSKFFLQTQSFFIVWNKKQMIFLLGKTGSREKRLLNFKRSSKTFTLDTKAISNYIYLM